MSEWLAYLFPASGVPLPLTDSLPCNAGEGREGADRDSEEADIRPAPACERRRCGADGERRSAPYLTFPRKRGKESISFCVPPEFASEESISLCVPSAHSASADSLPCDAGEGINPFPQFPISQPALCSCNPSSFDPILGSQFIYCFR